MVLNDLGRPGRAGYAELHAHSSFSFLDGASSPEELVEQAVKLGLSALALTDHDGLSGVVRFATAARDVGLPTVIGAELGVDVALPRTKTEREIAARAGVPDPSGRHLLVLARDPTGYAALCRVISRAQLRGGLKGRPQWDHVAPPGQGPAAADGPSDQFGPSSRVPALIIGGGFTRSGVDHQAHDTTSVLATIEHAHGLAPLGTRDTQVTDLRHALLIGGNRGPGV